MPPLFLSAVSEYIKVRTWRRLAIILIALCIVGIAFRSVHHSDWLVFKSDQARDALIMTQAIANGPISLPLLGPEAGSTKFRLGPISYYFQYASGKLFGATPEGYAYPDLIFGILTIPLLFFLFRKFLSSGISLWLTALASVSLFLVTFSRFAWNPNTLPFFTAFFAWFFLNALENEGKKRTWYLIAAAICAGVIAQLHLVAILGLGLGLSIFLIFSKTLKMREILLCISIAVALQFPIFIYEWQTNGANTHAFIGAASGEKYQDSGHIWYEKIFRAYQESAHMTWIIATGKQNTDMITTRGLSFKCDQKCQDALPYSLFSMALFCLVIFATYRSLRTPKDPKQKNALIFMLSWFASFLLVIILVAYEAEARFYLGIIPPLFLSLGLTAQYLLDLPISKRNALVRNGFYVIGVLMILLNIQATTTYLYELARSQVSAEESGQDLRFGTESKVTLGQLRAIASETKHRFTPNVPLLITGESHHVKSMYYVLAYEYGYHGCYLRGTIEDIPAGFDNLFIEDYDPSSPDGLMPFGTLGASFQPAESPDPTAALPEKCLTY